MASVSYTRNMDVFLDNSTINFYNNYLLFALVDSTKIYDTNKWSKTTLLWNCMHTNCIKQFH